MIVTRTIALIMLTWASTSAIANTCMVSPTDKKVVSGRFGKWRKAGAHGSKATLPHMHNGLDFSTDKQKHPLYATTDGTIFATRYSPSFGNTVTIKRDNEDIVFYAHLSEYSVKAKDKVNAGAKIGLAGKTGMKDDGAIHLHYIYGVPKHDDARAKKFDEEAAKNRTFNPAQLESIFRRADPHPHYVTDPSPYFCQTFPIPNDKLSPILGSDTKTQYSRLFGSVPPMGVPPSTKIDSVQVAAANGEALQAAASGATSVASVLSDEDGYGAVPSPPIGGYETMSPSEMLATEAKRRFADVDWNVSITKVSSRALWVDYLRALGVSAYINEAIRQKKERVEALMALYTAQKLNFSIKSRTDRAQEQAQRADVTRNIK